MPRADDRRPSKDLLSARLELLEPGAGLALIRAVPREIPIEPAGLLPFAAVEGERRQFPPGVTRLEAK